ncbi:spermidine/putrescine ABC transporter ATP-binding protein [Rhodobacter sp. TJ_12]|uniref:ABC transporter ATP-binding protein n=1 Tax=Rhodobacter sp. TJ_12 TaxID=2029399 RepID=UPI001CBF6540|nr:ABC transporter ATP-binding protein [Rhodobacter sp. TJ_12]MBZ4023803.1 spermidine/putrescine ABC transporter ATP-binding protein [Rhodobacter sp. TJ_12]
MTADVHIHGVEHRFDTFTALHRVDLKISAGEFIVLLGPSGCGKTTLLSIIGGFLSPSEGNVLIGGKDMSLVAPRARPTTTVFQDYALFPHMSLRDNVAFGLRMRGVGRAARHKKALEMLDLVGLSDKGDRKPHALSGGQRQRVALARALAVDPDVLLLDEPLGALDLKLRRQMQDELKAIQRSVGTTFIHVTHDQEEAMAIADRIVVMNQGRIEHCGTPEEVYLTPKTLFSANFMGEMNRIPVTAAGQGVASPLGLLPLAPQTGTLCLRPENLGLAGEVSLGPARLEAAAFFGSHHRCHFTPLAAPDLRLIAHLPQGRHPAPGEEVELFATHPVILAPEAA